MTGINPAHGGWSMGFDFACDGIKFRNCWLTHEPSTSLADGAELNIHGHLHNIWDGFGYHSELAQAGPQVRTGKEGRELKDGPPIKLRHDWQRLFAIEYTDYYPIEFEHFVSHPDKYQSKGKKK